jgi:HAD superfamily hydrolase (TIGR01490 family)
VTLALFDFDGTITREDTFIRFVRFATPRYRFRAGTAALLPFILGYKVGWLSGPNVRAKISRVAFLGTRENELDGLGKEFAQRHIPDLVRENARERLEWHRAQGHRIVVVSASLDVYLRPWCEKEGLELICTRLERRSGRITGKYLDGDCSGEEKRRRILKHLNRDDYADVYAYGDTAEDRQMLELANRRYFRWREVSE